MKNLKVASAMLAVLIVLASAFTKSTSVDYGFISKVPDGPNWKYTVIDLVAIEENYDCEEEGPGCLITFPSAPTNPNKSGQAQEILEFTSNLNISPSGEYLFTYSVPE